MLQQNAPQEVIIDGEGAILGRLSTYVAKLLLSGKKVVIVNADKIAVSGEPTMVISAYRRTVLGVKVHFSEKWRPKRSRSPVNIVRKAVRGMLPKNSKGREALSRLRVFIGVPRDFKGSNLVKLPSNMTVEKLTRSKYITLAEVSRQLGWSR